ncbi:MAG: TetR/AcrR family transcriptional regulator [Alphaproteobacteria bacterium]|nr:TetR/AcrR family transcriptional regulator [Alphaproteobacteria bacterium]
MPIHPLALDSRRAAYRERILAAAEEVFARDGFAGARIADVVAASGLSLGTVYGLYDGKAAIYAAVHEHRLTELLAASAEAVTQGDPGTVLLSGTAGFVRWLADHPGYLRMHVREGLSWTSPDQFASDVQVASWSRGIELIVGVLEAGIATGVFVPGEPQRMARLVAATQQVFVMDWVDRGCVDPIDTVVDDLSACLRRTFFVAAPPAPRSA